MKISVLAFSTLLASSAFASKASATSNLRKRHLQFGFEQFFPDQGGNGQGGGSSPINDLLEGLSSGFENMVDLSGLQAMDPLVLSEGDSMTFEGDGTNLVSMLTNCTGNLTITLDPAVLTGLSTLTMDRFELVPNTEQVSETGNWWDGLMMWSGTFDMLATADAMILTTGVKIVSQDDKTCIPQEYQAADGSFRTGITMSLMNPVMEMFLQIGGNTPEGFLNSMFGTSEADTIQADNVTFTYDSWTMTFDNPNINQTIDVMEMIQMGEALLGDLNITDFDIESLGLPEELGNLEDLGGLTDFIQDQTNAVARNMKFNF